MMEPLILTGSNLTFENVHQVVAEYRPVELDPEAAARVTKARQVLFDMAAKGQPVYGLNRGGGLEQGQGV